MKRTFALTLAGALAAGVAMFAAPQDAQAQVGFSVGIGSGFGAGGYWGSGYRWGAPAYSGIGFSTGYYGGYDPAFYEPVVVTRRVVTAPTYYVQPRTVVRYVQPAPRVVTRRVVVRSPRTVTQRVVVRQPQAVTRRVVLERPRTTVVQRNLY